LQRLRVAIAHPGEVRPGWSVIAEIARRVGLDLRVLTSSMAFAQLAELVPFYKGITLEQISGRGVRWPERPEAAAMPAGAAVQAVPDGGAATDAGSPDLAAQNGSLRLGTYRPIWASPEVEISPVLRYTIAKQQLELSPADAQRLGVRHGELVDVAQLDDSSAAQSGEAGRRARGRLEGTRLKATAAVRTGVPAGTAFLADGIASNSANALTEPLVEVSKP
jgi:NADH-quinone oxidoreductase subunit G